MKQIYQPCKSILRVCSKIWLCSGSNFILFHVLPQQILSYNVFNITLYTTICIKMLFLFFGKHNTSLCLFCNLEDKAVIHVFVLCSKTKRLRCTVIEHFKRNIILYYYHRVPFWSDDKVFLILNHLLLLFKYYVYFEEVQKLFLLKSYLQSIMKVYKLEKTLDQSDERKKNYLQETFKRTSDVISLKSVILQILQPYSELSHTFRMELFAKLVNNLLRLACARGSIFDV